MAHNQSANKLSSRAFGENLRGQLAMMASSSEKVSYQFQRLEDVPNPGTLYDDDNYISSVTARVYHDFVMAELTLSTGYNQLGARVEINNAIRQFEIPAAEGPAPQLTAAGVVEGPAPVEDNQGGRV
jgi:hypothetical protein